MPQEIQATEPRLQGQGRRIHDEVRRDFIGAVESLGGTKRQRLGPGHGASSACMGEGMEKDVSISAPISTPTTPATGFDRSLHSHCGFREGLGSRCVPQLAQHGWDLRCTPSPECPSPSFLDATPHLPHSPAFVRRAPSVARYLAVVSTEFTSQKQPSWIQPRLR